MSQKERLLTLDYGWCVAGSELDSVRLTSLYHGLHRPKVHVTSESKGHELLPIPTAIVPEPVNTSSERCVWYVVDRRVQEDPIAAQLWSDLTEVPSELLRDSLGLVVNALRHRRELLRNGPAFAQLMADARIDDRILIPLLGSRLMVQHPDFGLSVVRPSLESAFARCAEPYIRKQWENTGAALSAELASATQTLLGPEVTASLKKARSYTNSSGAEELVHRTGTVGRRVEFAQIVIKFARCPRCGGMGWLPQFVHVENGVCFGCGGSGWIERAQWQSNESDVSDMVTLSLPKFDLKAVDGWSDRDSLDPNESGCRIWGKKHFRRVRDRAGRWSLLVLIAGGCHLSSNRWCDRMVAATWKDESSVIGESKRDEVECHCCLGQGEVAAPRLSGHVRCAMAT